ncbi:MAG: hypothetical protein ACTHM6_16505 [Tepidisphaeraceae bacterium]
MPFAQTSFLLSMALLVRVGQAMFLCGTVRSKNGASMAVRLLLDLAVMTLSLWAIGAVFVPNFGQPSWMTFSHLVGIDDSAGFAFRVLPTLVIASAAVYAAAAERTRLTPLLTLSALLGALVIPLLYQAELRLMDSRQLIDNGIGLASVVGGTMGLVAAYVVGARKNKFNRDQSVNFLPGHHVVFQVLGLLLILAAWSDLSGGPVNAVLGASAAALAGAGYGRLRFGKVDTGLLLTAVIGGLCATGMSAAFMPSWAGVLLGAMAGAAVPWLVIFLETRVRIDEVSGLASAYLGGGAIGWIGSAVFSRPGPFSGNRIAMIFTHLGMLVAAVIVAAVVAIGVLAAFKKAGRLRVGETAEFDGADLFDLDVNAYPDFQQNMIKSHHLREL